MTIPWIKQSSPPRHCAATHEVVILNRDTSMVVLCHADRLWFVAVHALVANIGSLVVRALCTDNLGTMSQAPAMEIDCTPGAEAMLDGTAEW